MEKYVAYYRVSTKNQGLGIDAQKESVKKFVIDGTIVAEFQEKESGKNNKRKELAKAIAFAKENNAVLIVAKLDRLARNASFLFSLKESGVNFRCADLPQLNTLTLGMYATIAQHEAEIISQRTKDALAVLKRNGVKLGNPTGKIGKDVQSLGGKARAEKARDKAKESYQKVFNLIAGMKNKGYSLGAIAEKLNADGYKTSKGGKFQATQVMRLFNLFTE